MTLNLGQMSLYASKKQMKKSHQPLETKPNYTKPHLFQFPFELMYMLCKHLALTKKKCADNNKKLSSGYLYEINFCKWNSENGSGITF